MLVQKKNTASKKNELFDGCGDLIGDRWLQRCEAGQRLAAQRTLEMRSGFSDEGPPGSWLTFP